MSLIHLLHFTVQSISCDIFEYFTWLTFSSNSYRVSQLTVANQYISYRSTVEMTSGLVTATFWYSRQPREKNARQKGFINMTLAVS